MLPIPPPMQICPCGPSQAFTVIPGKADCLGDYQRYVLSLLLNFYNPGDEIIHNSGLLIFVANFLSCAVQ